MATIAPPWPPADPTLPLSFDHRGCCGPIDVCGLFRQLQLRYTLIGVRSGGPVGAGWLWIATGQLMVADSTTWLWEVARSTGALPATPGLNYIDWQPIHTLPNRLAGYIQLSIDAAATTLIQASTINAIGYCSNLAVLTVDNAIGPADPPDRLEVRPLKWYEASPYPYLG